MPLQSDCDPMRSSQRYDRVCASDSADSLLPSEQDEAMELRSPTGPHLRDPGSFTPRRNSEVLEVKAYCCGVAADLTIFEKYLLVTVVASVLSASGVALWYYLHLYLLSVDNPTMSITQEAFPLGDVRPFNITFFPQIALDLTETWNSELLPACSMQGHTSVKNPPCIASLFATMHGGYQGFFSVANPHPDPPRDPHPHPPQPHSLCRGVRAYPGSTLPVQLSIHWTSAILITLPQQEMEIRWALVCLTWNTPFPIHLLSARLKSRA